MSTPVRRPDAAEPVRDAAVLVGGFVALLWLLEIVDTVLGNRLDAYGVQPRSDEGLVGVATAPLLHLGFGHLVSNTLPLLVLGFVIALSGIGRALAVAAIVWVVGGLGTWLVAPAATNHIGASVLVFGFITYLVARGFFSRSPGQVAIGVVVLLVYGGALWGVLPGQPGISWQGHLFGALGGVVAAALLAPRRTARAPRRTPEVR
ncbi:rhomboid family intramembrane serine protease [Nocardioides sp. ChNu-153]|uniref:rhomboid family intramembrane serine protease n=1 Tax=unclassified Nocardioides TaxID=2615069 RepID=UPI002405C8A3|nr:MULTISPECIES: rhomboid family intramembrane serine protease [unclassified Nocardioides]MDF9716209.1 rhomboid family intramembrane serine protease [Nocardioides sp. ChNu-99]MDN7121599.1 rhomboid family intramembrane serine protease [Nocardioides sp. ChNu-153]